MAIAIVVGGMLVITAFAAGGEGSLTGVERRGAELYAENCAACHGPDGKGAQNWRVADVTGALPAPPHDATGHTWHHADGLLLRIIRGGCAVYSDGSQPCNMPAFGEQLNDDQIRSIIEFMRRWWGPEQRAFQQEVTSSDPFP